MFARILPLAMMIAVFPVAAQAGEGSPIFDIPRLDKIAIDGKADDWGDGGFRVDLLTPVSGDLKPITDHDARVRLGWNDRGLLVLALIRDNEWLEHPKDTDLWQCDALEVFLSERCGSANMCQWIISPGMDPEQPEPRWRLYDFRREPALKGLPAEPTVARAKGGDLCVLEVLLPWSALRIDPQVGREVGIQVYADDTDGRREYAGYNTAWYPEVGAHMFYDRVHRLRLAERAGDPVLVRGKGEYDIHRLRTNVSLAAQGDCVGKTVRLLDGQAARAGQPARELARGKMEPDAAGRAMALISFEMPTALGTGGLIVIETEGNSAGSFVLPDPARTRATLLMHTGGKAEPSVFGGERLPPVTFERLLWMERLIGPYRIDTTFYDKDYNVVTKAKAPGRYGAVAEVVTADGRKFRRFITLFRRPDTLSWWDTKVSLELPADCGIDPRAAAAYPEDVQDFIKEQIDEGTWRSSDAAVLLAGLHETKVDTPKLGFYTSPRQLDRQ